MELSRFSFWDSLVVTAAEEAGCGELPSGDSDAAQFIVGFKSSTRSSICRSEDPRYRYWRRGAQPAGTRCAYPALRPLSGKQVFG